MAGIVVLSALNLGLLYITLREKFSFSCLIPGNKDLIYFLFGFLITAAGCASYLLLQTFYSGTTWDVNESYSLSEGVKGSWWVLKSVLFEELIFRGSLLYILVKKTGMFKGCLVSAAAFGIYHWFSYGIMGDIGQMVIVFIITGIWGFMYAYSFSRTNTLLAPIGLHLGWNLVNIVVFSQGPIGNQLLIASEGESISSIISLLIFLFQVIVVPAIVFLYFRKSGTSEHL